LLPSSGHWRGACDPAPVKLKFVFSKKEVHDKNAGQIPFHDPGTHLAQVLDQPLVLCRHLGNESVGSKPTHKPLQQHADLVLKVKPVRFADATQTLWRF
jgi:hypothetical protein